MATDKSPFPSNQLPEPLGPPESFAQRNPADDADLRGDADNRFAELNRLFTQSARLYATRDIDPLLDEILSLAVQFASADVASLLLVDEATNDLYVARAHALPTQVVANARIRMGDGIAGCVAKRQQPLLLVGAVNAAQYPNAYLKPRKVSSSICVPILEPTTNDKTPGVIGVINASRRPGTLPLTQEDVDRMTAFCAHVGNALYNALMAKITHRRESQIQDFLDVGQNLLSSLEVEVVLQSIINRAVEYLHCESGSLLLMDELSNELVFKVVTGPASGQLLETRLPSDVGIVGTVAKTGVPLIVNDAKADPRHYSEVDNSTALTTRSLLCVPMRNKEHTLGVIEVMNKLDGTPFDETDRDALSELAIPSAIALEHARLYSELRRSFADTVHIITNAVEARDPNTAGHTSRVTHVAIEIARELMWSHEHQAILEIGALLHDIGKIGVPDVILRKPGRLTSEEYFEMKQHPILGAQMLKGVSALRPMLPYVLYHQERFDGKGYPFGLVGADIPIEGRLLAVADTFDAMTSNRPYRQRMDKHQAITEIVRHKGTQFDPAVVDAFLRIVEKGKLENLPALPPPITSPEM